MQFTKIALAAVATLAVVGQAQAATRFLTGASATSLNATKALISLCNDATGAATIYKQDTTTSSLGNFFTVKCSKDFAGLAGTNAVAFNVDGGSFTAVEASTGGVGVKFSPATGGTAVAGTGNLAGFALQTGVTATGTQLSEGGFMDIEPAAFGSALIDVFGGVDGLAPNLAPASFNQVFGIAVSKKLYTDLQAAQGITVPTGADDRAPIYQPTISRAQYATIVANDFNEAKTAGAAFLGSSGKLTVCRRGDTSGTQASSNQYFLNNLTGNTPGVNGGTTPASSSGFPLTGADALATFGVSESATTSLARTCLSSTTAANIGVLSLENTPATTDNYRYVKLSRVEGFDVTGTNRSKATAKTGEYDFVFNSMKYTAAGAGSSDVIEAIDSKLNDLTTNNGLFGSLESTYNRNGNNANVITKK